MAGKKKKTDFTTLLLVAIMLAGLGLVVYPSFSDYWNSFHQSRAIASYDTAVKEMDTSQNDALWQEAVEYNKRLTESGTKWTMSEEELEEYSHILDITGTGIMGYVKIPELKVSLPIYHGTDEAVLQIAVGHVAGSSLPTGGVGTHCTVSGHTGLPSAKLFTDIDKLIEGDLFELHVLNHTMTYMVDQISVVLPHEMDGLKIDPEQDYATLVTCTPYGINSHRLLVRGHQVETPLKEVHIYSEAFLVPQKYVVMALTVPIFLLVIVLFILLRRNA